VDSKGNRLRGMLEGSEEADNETLIFELDSMQLSESNVRWVRATPLDDGVNLAVVIHVQE